MTGMSRPLNAGEQVPSYLKVDRISHLPTEILANIFRKLSIVDIVRTSVLSKDWRYRWLSHSDFDLDSYVISHVLNHRELRWDIVASVMHNCVLHHTSSIRSFSLAASCSEHYPDMYEWIKYLSEQSVEELYIEDIGLSHFKMPSHMFSFGKLKSLHLETCDLQIPSTFGGFQLLDKLYLRDVSISDADVSRLIRSCPLLEYITLLHISELKHLRIHAPRLSELVVDTRYEDIIIEAAPKLSRFKIARTLLRSGADPILNLQSVIHCLSCIGSLDRLDLSGDFIKLLITEDGLENFLLRNDAVSSLNLHTLRLDTIEVFRVCLSLLSSCRNIKCFSFDIESTEGIKLEEKFFKENCGQFTFPELERMTVVCFSKAGMESAVDFIDVVISFAPKLKFLIIRKEGLVRLNKRLVTNLLSRFRTTCPQASVSYEHFSPTCPF